MIRKSVSAALACAAVPAAAALALALAPSSAGAQQSAAAQCPATMPRGATEITCTCPATGAGASVWGTDYYTDDSGLCQAALHAGAIGPSGGMIGARSMPGRDYYTGSQRNGIASGNYGSWSRTIVFDGTPTVGLDTVSQCPGTYDANGRDWSGSCRCPGVAEGAVWGSNPYTTDSNLCRAAMHAGVIGAEGGLVHVAPAAGQQSYTGTAQNGITTNNWSAYGTSFRVSAAKN